MLAGDATPRSRYEWNHDLRTLGHRILGGNQLPPVVELQRLRDALGIMLGPWNEQTLADIVSTSRT